MANEWPRRSVAELQEAGVLLVEDGNHGEYRPRREEFAEHGEWSFIRAADMERGRVLFESAQQINETAFRRIRKGIGKGGDVLFSHKGTVGKLAVAPLDSPPFVCSPQTTFWRTLDESRLTRRFLYCYMQSPAFVEQWMSRKGETDMADYVSLTTQRKFEIGIPPIDEQRAVSAVLGALDDKVEQNYRTGRALEGLVRAMFQAWFVDFEPVKAKAAGQTSFPGMPTAAFAVLPDRLTDSPMGPVPQGWVVQTLAEAFDINPPRRLSKGADAPYLDMKNMPIDGHAPDTWARRPHGSGMRFVNGDTLVARITPCLENGKTAYVDFLNEAEVGWGSTEYIVLRPKPPLPEVYAYCLARTPGFRDFAIQSMSGTSGRQRVAASALEHYHIAIPNAATAAAFGDLGRPLFECIRAGKAVSSKLATLRDYLLPRLMAGSVRVRSKAAS